MTQVSSYKSLEAAMTGGNLATTARFGKVLPNKSRDAFMNDFREIATLVRTDVYWVAASIRP